MGAFPVLTIYLYFAVAAGNSGSAQQWPAFQPLPVPGVSEGDAPGGKGDAPAPAIAPIPVLPLPATATNETQGSGTGVEWSSLYRSASRFLAMEHGFRLLTEPGTRSGLKGSFIRNYGRSVSNLHGWADGDEFYVNYVGHPMQGSVAGFLWAHNDLRYRRAEFGTDPIYWKARLRAAAFIWAYSTQFEIGPVSEASIGGIQATFPQQGFVDHVVTPVIGTAWMLGEDFVDVAIIKRIEDATTNRWVRILTRSSFNPARTFANVLGGRVPWARDTRPGVLAYSKAELRPVPPVPARPASTRSSASSPLIAPAEFAITFQPERFWGGNKNTGCLGGGANVGFRLSPAWQFAVDVAGCKMIGLEKDLSGDSLTYAVGPRWFARIRGPWSASVQVLVGGNKITAERMNPGLKKALEVAAVRLNQPPPSHEDYTEETESNGFTVSTGGGLSYSLSAALTIKVADVSYRHSWTNALWSREFSNALKMYSGIVLRLGTW